MVLMVGLSILSYSFILLVDGGREGRWHGILGWFRSAWRGRNIDCTLYSQALPGGMGLTDQGRFPAGYPVSVRCFHGVGLRVRSLCRDCIASQWVHLHCTACSHSSRVRRGGWSVGMCTRQSDHRAGRSCDATAVRPRHLTAEEHVCTVALIRHVDEHH